MRLPESPLITGLPIPVPVLFWETPGIADNASASEAGAPSSNSARLRLSILTTFSLSSLPAGVEITLEIASATF